MRPSFLLLAASATALALPTPHMDLLASKAVMGRDGYNKRAESVVAAGRDGYNGPQKRSPDAGRDGYNRLLARVVDTLWTREAVAGRHGYNKREAEAGRDGYNKREADGRDGYNKRSIAAGRDGYN